MEAPFCVRRRRKNVVRRLNALCQVFFGHKLTHILVSHFLASGSPPGTLRGANTPAARVARNMPAIRVALRGTDAGALINALVWSSLRLNIYGTVRLSKLSSVCSSQFGSERTPQHPSGSDRFHMSILRTGAGDVGISELVPRVETRREIHGS